MNLSASLRSVLCAAGLVALPALAHAEAHFDPASRMFRLDGGQVTYAFGVNANGALQSVYWGARLAPSDMLKAEAPRDLSGMDPANSITPQEYPGWGGPMYTEPALKLADPAFGARIQPSCRRAGWRRITSDALRL